MKKVVAVSLCLAVLAGYGFAAETNGVIVHDGSQVLEYTDPPDLGSNSDLYFTQDPSGFTLANDWWNPMAGPGKDSSSGTRFNPNDSANSGSPNYFNWEDDVTKWRLKVWGASDPPNYSSRANITLSKSTDGGTNYTEISVPDGWDSGTGFGTTPELDGQSGVRSVTHQIWELTIPSEAIVGDMVVIRGDPNDPKQNPPPDDGGGGTIVPPPPPCW
jgi:hypothetical protein